MPPGQDAPAYADLRERAARALADAPGGLADDDLAAALFGAGLGGRWLPLIRIVLAGDDRIVHQDGRWQLAEGGGGAPLPGRAVDEPGPMKSGLADLSTPSLPVGLPGPIVALAVATTGADPRRHRIARIAVIRREAEVTTGRLDTPVRIGQRVAGYLRAATRVSDDELESAPSFAEIVPALRELAEGETVHVYGAQRARAFLEAEARRADLLPLSATFVEIDELIRALLPAGTKPGLQAAARELGVPYRSPGTPAADAEVSARIVERLRVRQGVSPGRAAVDRADGPPRPGVLLPFTRAWLQAVPEGPGVYLFEDRDGTTLYVGKASALNRRLAAYIGRQPGAHRQLEALAVRTASVTTIETPSDLEATLLEARLIRDRQPAFNVAQQARQPTTIIRAGPDEASPRVRLVGEVFPDGARYFGPFESASAARQALSVARAVYPAAFARRRGDLREQRRAVLDVCQLLAGQKAPAVELLQAAMRQAAASGDRVEVDRLRSALRDVQQLEIRPSMLAGLRAGTQLLVLERLVTGQTRTHLLQDGRRLVSVGWEIDWLPTDAPRLRSLADEMLQAGQQSSDSRFDGEAADHDSDESDDVSTSTDPPDPDEPALVMRWLTQAWARIEVARVPSAGD